MVHLDDLRRRADIVQVIGGYMPLTPAGPTHKGLCPFHAEQTPSFHVSRSRGFFHCFGCGAGGDVFKFLERHEHVSFTEAVQMVASQLGMET